MPGFRERGTGTVFHLNLGRRNKDAKACRTCGWIATRLCDWKMPDGRDCDEPICIECTTSPSSEKDLCPRHALAYKAWLAGRTNTTDGNG